MKDNNYQAKRKFEDHRDINNDKAAVDWRSQELWDSSVTNLSDFLDKHSPSKYGGGDV